MTPEPIKCGAKLHDGSQCQETASVSRMQYVYGRQPKLGDRDDHTLTEIHYHALCPNCGVRRIVEKPTAGTNGL